MSTRTYNSVVNRQEAEALKEMLFNRARERAAALSEETKESYTTNVKNDVMELARESFVANKNPFSLDKFEKRTGQETQMELSIPTPTSAPVGLGFEQRKAEQIKGDIELKNKISTENITNTTLNETMLDARADFKPKSNFLGALEFLNSQATVALVRSKGKAFDAIA